MKSNSDDLRRRREPILAATLQAKGGAAAVAIGTRRT
jgi:hypothetical protein